jgi:dUTP pyrophosphatase
MGRGFEKISFSQFAKDTNLSLDEYNLYGVPKRGTKFSAGYDFEVIFDFTLKPGESLKIPTGIKAFMNENEVLLLIIRSSLGTKFNIRMCNQVGVIDCDYYNNPDNEGHIMIMIKNEGKEVKHFKRGERICQGIFTKYLTSSNEDEVTFKRTGGFGSTNKEEI